MAKRVQIKDEIDCEPRLRMPKGDVILRVCDKVKAIDGLTQKTRGSMEFGVWRRETENLLIHAFGSESRQVYEFANIRYSPVVYTKEDVTHRAYLRGLQTARECLLAIVTEVKDFYPDEPGQTSVSGNAKTTELSGVRNAGCNSRKVFVVHGHDEGMKSSVARFLEKLDLHPIILHEQPNEGKTIIEKFEANADVAFAVVLISPDDEGNEKGKKDKLQSRARQNVILELGYFIGRLGRAHVCALQSGDIETPTDVLGVLYVPYDLNGGWKIQLVKEIRAAGISLEDAKCTMALMV